MSAKVELQSRTPRPVRCLQAAVRAAAEVDARRSAAREAIDTWLHAESFTELGQDSECSVLTTLPAGSSAGCCRSGGKGVSSA